MIKFRHYRSLIEVATPIGVIAEVNSRGGATLAFTDDVVEDKKQYVGSFAFCAPSDNYNKRYGRAKATGFLNQNAARNYRITDYNRHFISDAETMREFLSEMDDFMLDHGFVPY